MRLHLWSFGQCCEVRGFELRLRRTLIAVAVVQLLGVADGALL